MQLWARHGQGYTLSSAGTQYKVTLQTPRIAELSKVKAKTVLLESEIGNLTSCVRRDANVGLQSIDFCAFLQYMPVRKDEDYSKVLRSPMPGKVHSIAVKEGEHVRVGQVTKYIIFYPFLV